MSRYIDADALIAKWEEDIKHIQDASFKAMMQGAINEVSNAPTADVVEVVRCKDCKLRKIEFGWNGKRYKMCANTDYPTDDDAYCSYGERREDDEQIH